MKSIGWLVFVLAFGNLSARAEFDWKKATRQYEENVRIAARYPFREFEKAAKSGDVATVKRLLDQGVPADIPLPCPEDSWEGIPPCERALHLAASNGHIDVVRLLLDRGADPNGHAGEGNFTPLHATDDIEIAKLLISRGADVNARDDDGWQPIHSATIPGYLENRRKEAVAESFKLIKFLIEHGADPLAADKRRCQPIHVAAEHSTREVVSFFIGRHAKVDAAVQDKEDYSRNGWQPLHCAANRGDMNEALDVAAFLIDKGADVNAITAEGETPLHLSENAAMTCLLLDRGAKVNVTSTGIIKQQPIHNFALRGDTESIRLLLDRGVDPNALRGSTPHETPLDIAVFFNRQNDAALLLLKCGAKPTKHTLEAAERSGNQSMIRLIRTRLDSSPKRPPHRQ